MSDIPKIIHSDIVDSYTDDFWAELPEVLQQETPKKTLVISEDYTDGSEEDTQLKKILNACQLNDTDYFLLKMSKEQRIAWHKLKAQFQPETVLLFGVLPMQLGISSLFMLNAINRYDDTVWIASLPIPQMEEQLEAKKKLWTAALKPHFIDRKQS